MDMCGRLLGFRTFVSVAMVVLIGSHAYIYFLGPQGSINVDLSDVKTAVMQLTRGLLEVSRKHDRLQSEMERVASALPAIGTRAKDVTQPTLQQDRRKALDIFEYDRQVADYALESAGARIIDTGSTVEHQIYESPVQWGLHVLTSIFCSECLSARAIINPGTLPGECWAFRGSRGEVTIRLLGSVRIDGVSLEHVPAHITPTREISSAPRQFVLEGLQSKADPYPHDFGSFEYDKEGKPIQYFEVQSPSPRSYNLVRVKILSNWGHPVYTCVYRVRIHGDLVLSDT